MPERTSMTTDAAGRRVMAKVGVTAEEAATLVEQLNSLDEVYRRRPPKAGTRRVHVLLAAVPEPD